MRNSWIVHDNLTGKKPGGEKKGEKLIMNKLFTKIAALALGATMAVGVGVAVASSSKEAVPVEASSTGTYALVTSTTGIAAGDTVIIVNHAGSQALKSISTTSTKYGTLQSVSVSNSKITLSSASVAELVVRTGSASGSFAFEGTSTNDAGGGTAIANGKYLTWTSSNSLNIATSISNNSSFTLNSYSAGNGMTIANCATTTRLLRYNTTSGQERFACYTTSTGTLVDIYKKEAATYTVSYDKNAGSDTVTGMPSQATGVPAGKYTLSDATPVRSGYTFLGWGLTSSATETVTSIEVDGNETVYAIWQVASTPAVTVSPTAASGYRGQTVTLTATPNAYITPTKYVWTTTNASIAKLGSSSSTSVETATNTIVVTYGGDSASSATVTVKGVDESSSTETSAVSCAITVTASTHSLTLSPNTAQSIAVGGSVNVTATSTGSGAYSSANVTATTSNSSKVTVDGGTTATKASGSSFTLGGVAGGSATITFTTPNGDSETLVVSVEKSIYDGVYQLCTSTDDLEANAFYVIGASKEDGEEQVFLANDSNTNNRKTTTATISASQVEVTEKTSHSNEIMVVKLEGSTGAWKFHTKNYGGTDGYFKNADSGTNNYLQITSTQREFSISFNASNHATRPLAAVITATSGSSRNTLEKNSTSDLFSCYSAGTQSPVYLYKQVDVVPISSLTIPSTYGSGGDFYEGQEWTVSPTYNPDATTKTSELQIVSGGSYIEVSGLKVTAKADAITSGTTASATVKAVATDGSGTESNNCVITITKASVTGVEVTTNPTKTSYVEGQTLDLTGMVVTLTWNHGGTTTISGAASGLTTTPSLSTHLTVADHDGIEVSVTYAGITSGVGDGFEISVVTKQVSSIKEWTGQTTSYAIDSKLVADGSIVVVYNDETESEPLSVATLWANGEVTFKLGGTSVTPGSTTLNSSDNGKSLTITYSGHQKSVTIHVRAINYQFLTRVESTADLVAGETYIIAGFETAADVTKTYVMSSQTSGKPEAIEWTDSWHDEYEIESVNYPVDSLRADLASYGWTLGGEEGAWTFTSVDGNLLGYGTSGTDFVSGGTNHEFSISANGTNGYWKVQFNASGSTTRGVVFRGGSTMKFAPYAISNVSGSDEYHYVEIYRVYDVTTSALESWSDTIDYIDEINCHDSGSYDFDTGKSWSTMTSAFNDLDIEVRAYIKHASYVYDGVDTTATFGTDSDVAKFVCKYDYIVDKYKWNDFIGRDGTTYDLFNSSTRISPLGISTTDRSAVSVVVVISVISITCIGGYFFLRKRKEQ